MNWNQFFNLVYQHPVTSFFLLLALGFAIYLAKPFPLIKHEHIYANGKVREEEDE